MSLCPINTDRFVAAAAVAWATAQHASVTAARTYWAGDHLAIGSDEERAMHTAAIALASAETALLAAVAGMGKGQTDGNA